MRRLSLWILAARALSAQYVPALPNSILFSQATPVTVSGTVSPSTLLSSVNAAGSLTLPAGYFAQLGGVLRITYRGLYQSGASTAKDSYGLSLGSTTVATATPNAVLGSVTGGTVVCQSTVVLTATAIGVSATVAVEGSIQCGDTATTNGVVWIPFLGTGNTFNSTTTQVINLQVTPGNTAHVFQSQNVVLTSS